MAQGVGWGTAALTRMDALSPVLQVTILYLQFWYYIYCVRVWRCACECVWVNLSSKCENWKVVSHPVTWVSGVFQTEEVELAVTRMWCHHQAVYLVSHAISLCLPFFTLVSVFFLCLFLHFCLSVCASVCPHYSPCLYLLLLHCRVGVCFFFYEWDVLFTLWQSYFCSWWWTQSVTH